MASDVVKRSSAMIGSEVMVVSHSFRSLVNDWCTIEVLTIIERVSAR